MQNLLNSAREQLKSGEPAMLVSILSSDGSSPRGRGAMMLCSSDGLLCGSVGGGALEARCLELAAADLAEGASCVREFTLGSASAELPQMLCGGKVTLAFTCLSEERECISQTVSIGKQHTGTLVDGK